MHTTDHLIELALQEDIGSGDITTNPVIPDDQAGNGLIIAKESLVLAGLEIVKKIFRKFDENAAFTTNYSDGDQIENGLTILTIRATLKALLTGERTALNFLQKLSGIATNTRSFIDELGEEGQGGTTARIVDTRKTTPGLRTLEKYAVRVGGAFNHRMGLYDGVLIKDNHIAACGSIEKAVKEIRRGISHLVKIEVETGNLDEVKEALDAGADVIMLDNMDIPKIKEALALIQGKAVTEVSGNVTKKDLKKLSETGVDIISIGALTHSARFMDISMRIKSIPASG